MRGIFFIALVAILLTACAQDVQKECSSLGGKWVKEFKECESISKDQCASLGGQFDECASACRHDPEAEFCTLQCVQVCRL